MYKDQKEKKKISTSNPQEPNVYQYKPSLPVSFWVFEFAKDSFEIRPGAWEPRTQGVDPREQYGSIYLWSYWSGLRQLIWQQQILSF